jgi:pimeloyl-ACP methyl ester carboxylesterase
MRARTIVAVTAAAAALAGATPAYAQPTLQPTRCERGLAAATRCATLTVPLDRSGATAGTLTLPVRVLPAKRSAPRRGPLLLLAGGPGQAGRNDRDYAALLAAIAPGYDIVSFDQRGTGGTALRCKALSDVEDPESTVEGSAAALARQFAACASELGDPRRFYTSADSAADIDDLRAALGAEQIALGGTSYGTWVTQVYARSFPQRVSRLILDSVVGPGGVSGIARNEYAGARRILRDLCAGGACRAITRDLAGETAKLSARLESSPLRGRTVLPNGRVESTAIGGPSQIGLVMSLLYAGDLDPSVRAAFPAAVASARRGDPALLLRLAAAGGEDEEDAKQFSGALYAATTCAETTQAWSGADGPDQRRAAVDAALAAIPASELAPWSATTVRAGAALAGCLDWPAAPFLTPPTAPLPDVPALVMNGLSDVRTPVEDAVAVARQLPRATVVRIPHQGHSVLVQECARDALAVFLAGRPVGSDACRGRRTPASVPLTPVPPRTLSAVGPRGGSARAKAERSVRAVRLSVRDAGLALSLAGDATRAPGLRSGTVSVGVAGELATLRLRNYGYVPGLRVDGRIGLGAGWSGTLKVGGSAAARGTLTVRDGVARGRLGGVRVALRLQPAA